MSAADMSPTSLALHPHSQTSRSQSQRVLACVLCQQRKIKCDRKFPCANCIKSRKQCVPATLTHRRRRRKFPERELLERIRLYEKLLRQNDIKFEPLSQDPAEEKGPLTTEGGSGSDAEHPEAAGGDWSSPSTTIKSGTVFEARNLLCALNQRFQDPENESDSSHDDVSEVVITKAWDELFEDNDHLLFGIPKSAVELSVLHPEPAQIFRLWQIYLENVDPLLKITHTPSLLGRIVNAVSNVSDTSPTLEALMFGIYCTAIFSLAADDVQTMFGSSKEDLLSRCQFGCRQALSTCGVLRTSNRDCLTALYLYLISVRSNTVPRALSSMLGVAIRIAERMGIHSESALNKCTALEAEMRRRLWWSLVLYDTRIGEMANYKTAKLAPTWDCRIPLNVNDSDLRPEMKESPRNLGTSTEALFAVVRGEIGEFIRNTMFYLDFTAPALKPIAKDVQNGPVPEGGELVTLEKMIEDKYLKSCDPDNPLHFMTIWTARAFLAKYRLVEYHSKYSGPFVHQTESARDTAICHALNILECDTKLMSSPLTKGFLWSVNFHFPFPAYIQIVQELKRRPLSVQAEQAWTVMGHNYEARFDALSSDDSLFLKVFAKMILQSWEARELAFNQSGEILMPPKFVLTIRQIVAQTSKSVQNGNPEQPNYVRGMGIDDVLSMPMDFGSHMYGSEAQAGYADMRPGVNPYMPGQAPLDVDVDPFDWLAMNWTEPASQTGRFPPLSRQPQFDFNMNQLDSFGGQGSGEWPPSR
ncbi:hypothetical protein B7494_g4720 [Chlorociboria aeruginascens]|nr:hypothetical protein B7494_g4720 [Chlorociboria aeruginascens]